MGACIDGQKHKWNFVKNKERVSAPTPNRVQISLRGIYRCEHCKDMKWGNYRHDYDMKPGEQSA